MHVDECWYCGPCADRCPTGAVTVNMPYLLASPVTEIPVMQIRRFPEPPARRRPR